MVEFKGCRITTRVPNFIAGAKVPHVIYRVDRKDGNGWKLAREGVLYGPFDSPEAAHSAAETIARGWIDRHAEGR